MTFDKSIQKAEYVRGWFIIHIRSGLAEINAKECTTTTTYLVEADDLVHRLGAEDDLIKDRYTAPDQARIATLSVFQSD